MDALSHPPIRPSSVAQAFARRPVRPCACQSPCLPFIHDTLYVQAAKQARSLSLLRASDAKAAYANRASGSVAPAGVVSSEGAKEGAAATKQGAVQDEAAFSDIRAVPP